MATSNIAGNNITYPSAADIGTTSLLEPVIVAKGQVSNYAVNLRLDLDGSPSLIAECWRVDTNEVWYAPIPEKRVSELFSSTRQHQVGVVGLLQPHLAKEVARWIVMGLLNPEAEEAKLLDDIA